MTKGGEIVYTLPGRYAGKETWVGDQESGKRVMGHEHLVTSSNRNQKFWTYSSFHAVTHYLKLFLQILIPPFHHPKSRIRNLK